jgi:hypothetical protein
MVVVDVGVGKSALHAAYAVAYFGFDVTDVLGVEAPGVEGFFVSVTPCRVMQLRNAANAGELAPDLPANPPPPKEPAGRRLAQALNAALAFGFDANPPPPAPPAGGAPPVPPAGRVPVGALTPCDFRQLANAALDADFDVDVDVDVDDFVVVVVVFLVDEDGEALPHAASNTPATATPTSATEIVRNFDRWKLKSLVFPMATSMKCDSGRSLMGS